MNTHDNDPLHAPINRKLAEVLTALPTPPAWYDAWMQLGPDTTEEERLRVYQAIRAGDLWLLCIGMAGVGLQTSVHDLRSAGLAPVLAGAGQWLFLAAVSYGLASWLCR